MQHQFRRPNYYLCRTILCVLAIAAVCLSISGVRAQDGLPVLKANSPNIQIIDGTNSSRGDWILDPAVKLDTYNAIRSDEKRTITFKSDVDSRSFEVEPGRTYDFVIMLNGKDACKTRISTMQQGFERIDPKIATGPITIPITIERGKLCLKGTVNGSKTLTLIFDTGAESCALYPSAKAKGVKLTLDDTVLNAGTGGITLRQLARDNRLEIAGVRWNHEPFIDIERQADVADGIVGFSLFERKILEIDYDRMLMLVHDSLPSYSSDFSTTAMPFSGALPAVEVVMKDGDRSYRGPFILDTAGSGCMNVNQAFASEHRMHSTLKKVGSSVSRGVGSASIQNNVLMLPTLSIAGHLLNDVPLHVEMPSEGNKSPPGGVICMEVLSRFNTILDFRTNEAYFKPNERFGDAFQVRGRGTSIAIVVGVVLLLMVLGWGLVKRIR